MKSNIFSKLKIWLSLWLCISIMGCAFPKYETVINEKDKGYEKTFDPSKPLRSYKAINYVNIDDFGVMTVNPKVISDYDELEAPRVEKTAKERKAPDPIGAITVTALTLGLNLLFATSDTFKILTGDSKNERVIGTELDLKRAKKTGAIVQNTGYGSLTGPIRIEGLIDGPLFLYGDKDNKYNLAKYIRADTGYEVIKPLFITCLECQETIPNIQGITNSMRYDINFDEIKKRVMPQ